MGQFASWITLLLVWETGPTSYSQYIFRRCDVSHAPALTFPAYSAAAIELVRCSAARKALQRRPVDRCGVDVAAGPCGRRRTAGRPQLDARHPCRTTLDRTICRRASSKQSSSGRRRRAWLATRDDQCTSDTHKAAVTESSRYG